MLELVTSNAINRAARDMERLAKDIVARVREMAIGLPLPEDPEKIRAALREFNEIAERAALVNDPERPLQPMKKVYDPERGLFKLVPITEEP